MDCSAQTVVNIRQTMKLVELDALRVKIAGL